ncbi:hypothetical protein K469DRAFT_359653 [Zopfia rhizophila CBS 207.26]|uniref:Uncharacterized protein n=1 Tax=Zopfia rhizophila CBS 207.26 TaxID=1314779 RepID=A0A6A6EHX6_9PEZI|nr:hypothetical protein K469DRAFT_359653 [Zopfia rhizophila CBS 207.26]
MEDSEYIDPSIQRSEERIAGITIHGKHAHLYPALLPIPQWTIRRISNLRDRIERRDTHLPDQIDEFQKQSLGKALAHYHHHRICDKRLNDGEPTCINTVLQLMISRTESFGVFSRIGAYLIKGIHFPSYCKPFDLNKDYHTLTHVYVAGLAGLPDLYDLSSLGLRLAISPGANRIAIASWRTVKVWALDPKAFLNPEYGLRKAEGVPGDYCYIQGPGWQFYSANRIWGKDCVLLEPVELVSAGVVYGLEFRGEDELWGTTEMGLCRWGFGVKAQGRREEGLLE